MTHLPDSFIDRRVMEKKPNTSRGSLIDFLAQSGISSLFVILGMVPQKAGIRIGNFIGHTWYLLDRRHREIALFNLDRAFGKEKSPGERRRIARSTFKQLGRMLFEIGWVLKLDPKKDRSGFHIKGLEHLKNAVDRRKGVLLLTGHIGNWEALPVVAAMCNVPTSIVYRPLDYLPLNRFVEQTRSRFGAGLIPTARSMRKIIRTLKRGECVAMLMDQNFDCHEGVFADFFGHSACTNKGLALLARKTEAAVVPAFMVRDGIGYRVEIGPELPFVHTGDKIKDLEINTSRYNRVIESFIRRYPDQWFWVHQRWKTKPYHPWPRKL